MSGPSQPSKVDSAEHANYWKNRLYGKLPVLELPSDQPRQPVQAYLRDSQSLVLPGSVYAAIKAFCTAEDLTLFQTLVAASNILFLRYTGQTDLIVGSLCATLTTEDGGRRRRINPIALRIDLTGDPSTRECLHRVACTLDGAAEHREFPFFELVELVPEDADPSRAPIFQVMLILCDLPSAISEVPVLGSDLPHVAQYLVRTDLILLVTERHGSLTLTCEYEAALFKAASMCKTDCCGT